MIRRYTLDGAIDTVVQEIWHQGWTEFWRTHLCEYDARHAHKRLLPLIEAGIMPVDIYIEECHAHGMAFIAGFRMNDRHGHNADWFEFLSHDRPHWILKGYKPSSPRTTDPRSYSLGCALDYAVTEVRNWLFAIMEEATRRFDIDGIECNYTRLPGCFVAGHGEAHQGIMSDFLRRLRKMLDVWGRRKGRKLLLGVRVLPDLEGCAIMGFDVPTWIGEELIDYIVPGDIGFTDFNAKFEGFVRLARQTTCCVYPQIQNHLGYNHREIIQTPEHYKAAVNNFYGAGADGISTQKLLQCRSLPHFENFAGSRVRRTNEPPLCLLSSLGI